MKDLSVFKAKSLNNGGTTVIDHSIATKNFGLRCFDRIIKKDALWSLKYSNEKLRKSIAKVCICHDLLKVAEAFQKSLTNSTNSDDSDSLELTHDVMTWAFLNKYTNLSDDEKRTILYHHVLEVDGDLSVDDICYKIKNDIGNAKEMFLFFAAILKEDGIDVGLIENESSEIAVSNVTMYPKIRDLDVDSMDRLIMSLLMRAILIYSDRMVSKFYKDIDKFVSNDIKFMDNIIDSYGCSSIKEAINGIDFRNIESFDKVRLEKQEKLVTEISSYENVILKASTGFGKTFVGFRWWTQSNRKLFWVTPTISIAENSFRELNKIVAIINRQDDISIALLVGGDYKEGDENSDIIVSVIDSFLGMNVKNGAAHQLLNTLTCDIVFDEFQNYTNSKPMFSSFISMCGARFRVTNSRTLLLSATPPLYHNMFWGDNVRFIDFGVYDKDKKIRINVKEIDDISKIDVNDNSISIFNTVKNSQVFCNKYGNYENTILLHAYFTSEDSERLLNEVFENRSKNSDLNDRKTVFGTSIIGTGCDISAIEINDEVVSPENTIQRLGRGNRFNEYDSEVILNCIIVNNKSTNKFIEAFYECEEGIKIYYAWCNFLKGYNGRLLTKEDFYNLYSEFCDKNRGLFKKYWKCLFIESSASYSSMKPRRTSKKKNSKVISSRLGFRGVNEDIFVRAKKSDGSISGNIQIPSYKIENDGEIKYDAIKTHINYFKEVLPENIYKYKYGMRNGHELNINNWIIIAKHEESPLLLHSAVYDKKLGLLFG